MAGGTHAQLPGNMSLDLIMHRVLVVDRRLVLAVLLVATVSWVIRGKRQPSQGGSDSGGTGLLLGLAGMATWATTAMTGRPSGLGTAQGNVSLATLIPERDMSASDSSLFL